MSMIKIRKNAFLKIQTILAGSVVRDLPFFFQAASMTATMMSIVCPRAMRL
ncbi:Uncharacterised protein [Escherichia coli]|uniref:Uncharacterized protein n=1 Tax=Escherichia coli TaxID=562 RepID=A0A2X1LP35_ECOLX|nr:Uncharacterised protein [Escherichia coli]